MGFLLFFFCLPFPFLMFACLFETNFPNIPFLNPSCFHYWQFIFLLLFLFLFSWCMFQPFCFYVGFVFGILLFFICVFAFVLLLVLLSAYEKFVFPAILVFFLSYVASKGSFFFFVFSCLFFLCCLFPFIELSCIILFLCCCFVTRLSGLLVCTLWSFFFSVFVALFWICFFIPLKKRPPKKLDTAKTQKCKNVEKNDTNKNQLAQLCSQIVFFNFLGWA